MKTEPRLEINTTRNVSELLDYRSPPLEVCQTRGNVSGVHLIMLVEGILLVLSGILMVRSLEPVPFINGMALILATTCMVVFEVVQPRSWRTFNGVWNQYHVRGTALLFTSLTAMWGSPLLGALAAAVAVLLLVVPSLVAEPPPIGPIFARSTTGTEVAVVKRRRDADEEEAKYVEDPRSYQHQ
jgi:hypothetical protein